MYVLFCLVCVCVHVHECVCTESVSVFMSMQVHICEHEGQKPALNIIEPLTLFLEPGSQWDLRLTDQAIVAGH